MKGLYNKYRVEKTNGKTDEDATYFVLRIDKDIHARRALKMYIESVQHESRSFAADLDLLLRDTNDVFLAHQHETLKGSDSENRPA